MITAPITIFSTEGGSRFCAAIRIQRPTNTGVRANTVSGLSDINHVTGTENVAVIARSTL